MSIPIWNSKNSGIESHFHNFLKILAITLVVVTCSMCFIPVHQIAAPSSHAHSNQIAIGNISNATSSRKGTVYNATTVATCMRSTSPQRMDNSTFPLFASKKTDSSANWSLYYGLGSAQTYNVEIFEYGLPENSTWSIWILDNDINVSIQTQTKNRSMNLSLQSGNYSYLATPSGMNMTLVPGNFSVSNAQTSLTLRFPAMYRVTFYESNLPSQLRWEIDLDMYREGWSIANSFGAGANETISVNISNGTSGLAYNALYPDGWGSTNSLDIEVNGSATKVSVTFPDFYQVDFEPTGVLSGAEWSILLTTAYPSPFSFFDYTESSNQSIKLIMPNGTYNYSANVLSYSVSGEFNVTGAPLSIPIKLPSIYYVKFVGINYPISWDVIFNNTPYWTFIGNTVVVFETNGTYTYTVPIGGFGRYDPTPSSGTITINGSSKLIFITFKLKEYKVTFTESGLPRDTTWAVSVTTWFISGGDLENTSVGTTLSLQEPNGSYQFSISSFDSRYSPSVYSCWVTVSGSAVQVATTNFTLVTYLISFNETGLPAGAAWYLNISGNHSSGPIFGPSYQIELPNGTYNYTVGIDVSGYSVNASSIDVTGKNTTQLVEFSLEKTSREISTFPTNLVNYWLYGEGTAIVLLAIFAVVRRRKLR